MKLTTPFQDIICHIKALLEKAAAPQDTAQRCEYAHKIKELKSKAETILLDLQVRHGDDITTTKTDALWAPLDYAAFNTNMIFMEPYTKKLDIYKY